MVEKLEIIRRVARRPDDKERRRVDDQALAMDRPVHALTSLASTRGIIKWLRWVPNTPTRSRSSFGWGKEQMAPRKPSKKPHWAYMDPKRATAACLICRPSKSNQSVLGAAVDH